MSDETKDPFRETIEVAVGPNVDGPSDLARLAHTLPPDPEIAHAKDLLLPPATPATES